MQCSVQRSVIVRTGHAEAYSCSPCPLAVGPVPKPPGLANKK